ncbi:MAG: hypothetical protein QOD94_2860 [Alphaproteobacteria bacterium]|jgi:hypothetical protein|nr:hypothetical protein [Alphaproteobacteria bacterium]
MMNRGQAWIVAVALIGLAVVVPVGAWAGGELSDDDHDEGDTTKGPYGFVKDTRGNALPEATVTVDIKNRGQLVTQTNILGAYKIPAFGIEIKVEDVTISCKKDGYKQVSVVENGVTDPNGGFEVECTMQKL